MEDGKSERHEFQREKDFLWEIRGILKGSVLTVI